MACMTTAVTTAAPHAWLWNADTFSDFTFVLGSSDEGSSSSPSTKKVRRACSCPRPSLKAFSQTGAASGLSLPDNAWPSSALPAAGIRYGDGMDSSGPPAGASTFKLHAAVLSSASGYFKMLLTTPMDGWCPVCKVVTHVLEGGELDAAPHVLKFIYTNELPELGAADDWMLQVWMIKVGVCRHRLIEPTPDKQCVLDLLTQNCQ